jgi:hypothetical protein
MNPPKTFAIILLLLCASSCGQQQELQMNPQIDLSIFPEPTRFWLITFEDRCIELASADKSGDAQQIDGQVGLLSSHMQQFNKEVAADQEESEARAVGFFMMQNAEYYEVKSHINKRMLLGP